MNCPKCKNKMKLLKDQELNEKYYHCESDNIDILQSIAKTKVSKETARIIKYRV